MVFVSYLSNLIWSPFFIFSLFFIIDSKMRNCVLPFLMIWNSMGRFLKRLYKKQCVLRFWAIKNREEIGFIFKIKKTKKIVVLRVKRVFKKMKIICEYLNKEIIYDLSFIFRFTSFAQFCYMLFLHLLMVIQKTSNYS